MIASLSTLDFLELQLDQDLLTDQPLSTGNEKNRYLRFSLTNCEFLIPLGSLQEIFRVTISAVIPVPELASYVVGIYNWRGGLAWMVDLSELLTGEVLTRNFKEFYLTLLLPLKGQHLGFLVGQVDRIETFDPESILPISTGMIGSTALPFVAGYFLDPANIPLFLIDPERIAQSFLQS